MNVDESMLPSLQRKLRPITEADPKVLAQYVLSLLKGNTPKAELKRTMVSSLAEFLAKDTQRFVDDIVESLGESWSPSPEAEERREAEAAEREEEEGARRPMRVASTVSRVLASSDDESNDDDDDRNHKHRRSSAAAREQQQQQPEPSGRGPPRDSWDRNNDPRGREGRRGGGNDARWQTRDARRGPLPRGPALPPGPPPPNAEMYRDVSRGLQPPLPLNLPPNMRGGAGGGMLPFGYPGRDHMQTMGGGGRGGGRGGGGMFPPHAGRGGRGAGGMPWNGPPLPPGGPPPRPRKARCVDFFDKGCCLRGASCQFDHGVDRIVGAPGADGDGDAIVLTGGEEYNPDQPYWKPGGVDAGGGVSGGRSDSGGGRGRGQGRGGESGRGRGGGGEREQSNATLCVSQLPVDVADEALRAHFSKFGEVAAMRVSRANKSNNQDFKPVAYVQMRTRGNAQAAFVSPDAVMGNRFVQLSWARYDVLDKETRDGGGGGGGGGGEQDDAARAEAEAAARERAEKEKAMRAEKLKMMDQLKELTRRKQELLQQQIDKQKSLLRLAEKAKPTTAAASAEMGQAVSAASSAPAAAAAAAAAAGSPGASRKRAAGEASAGTPETPGRSQQPVTKRGRFQLDLRPKCVAVTLPAAAAAGSATELQAAVAAVMSDGVVAVTVPQPERAMSGGTEGEDAGEGSMTTVVLVTFGTHEKADAALKRGAKVGEFHAELRWHVPSKQKTAPASVAAPPPPSSSVSAPQAQEDS